VLHNFKTATNDGPKAFHQAFNDLFREQEWTAPSPDGRTTVVVQVKVNDADSWGKYRDMFPDPRDWDPVLDTVAGLMRQAYDMVLGSAASEAKACYLNEVNKELAELQSGGAPTS
jgi:hypothetical protein